jgi:hypothetical protein
MSSARACPAKSRGRERPFINPGSQARRLTVRSSLFSSADLDGKLLWTG